MIKKTDIYTVILVAGLAAIFSFVIANAVFKPGKNRVKVEDPAVITSEFPTLPNTFFNSDSINPTQIITIGDGTQQPFQTETQ